MNLEYFLKDSTYTEAIIGETVCLGTLAVCASNIVINTIFPTVPTGPKIEFSLLIMGYWPMHKKAAIVTVAAMGIVT